MGPVHGRDARDEAVEALFSSSYDKLFALAYALLGDRATAEEVTMDAFVKALGSWNRVKDPHLFESYVRRSLVNLAHTKWRRRKIEWRVNALIHRSQNGVEDLSWSMEMQETRREIWRAIGSLPWGQRTCVVLRYFEDLSETEMAEALDCSAGTVKRHLFRARGALKQSLNDRYENEARRAGP